jgi:hypothetical protein
MHAINEDLVMRLHTAWRRATATSRGLMNEIVTAEQEVTRANGRVATVEMQAQAYPDGRQEAGESFEAFQTRRNELAQSRAEGEDKLRRDLKAIGRSEDFALYAGRFNQASQTDFAAELASAKHALQVAENSVAELRQEQGVQGSRAGQLRQCLQQSAVWLRANGYGRLAAEIEP